MSPDNLRFCVEGVKCSRLPVTLHGDELRYGAKVVGTVYADGNHPWYLEWASLTSEQSVLAFVEKYGRPDNVLEATASAILSEGENFRKVLSILVRLDDTPTAGDRRALAEALASHTKAMFAASILSLGVDPESGAPFALAVPHDFFCLAVATLIRDITLGKSIGVCASDRCGSYFVRHHRSQRYCSPACGNRTRVRRFAQRKR